jgi:hypothetical protein
MNEDIVEVFPGFWVYEKNWNYARNRSRERDMLSTIRLISNTIGRELTEEEIEGIKTTHSIYEDRERHCPDQED